MTRIGSIPQDENFKPVLALWDDATGTVVPLHIGSKVTGADGNTYATLDVDVSVSVSPTSNQRINTHSGDIVSGSFASGALASGSIASGAIASGAIASGAVASGAIVDGASVTLGAKADTAITDATTTNTSQSFIKGLVKIFADVWDSTNHRIYTGCATNALFTTTQTAQGTGNSGDLDVSKLREVSIDVNITANVQGTNPTIQFEWDRKGADGIYYPIWYSDLINGLPANPTKISVSLGHGMQWPESLGNTGRLVWTVGGTSTPQYTFTPNVYGK